MQTSNIRSEAPLINKTSCPSKVLTEVDIHFLFELNGYLICSSGIHFVLKSATVTPAYLLIKFIMASSVTLPSAGNSTSTIFPVFSSYSFPILAITASALQAILTFIRCAKSLS